MVFAGCDSKSKILPREKDCAIQNYWGFEVKPNQYIETTMALASCTQGTSPCSHTLTVQLETSLTCTGQECLMDTISVVNVSGGDES